MNGEESALATKAGSYLSLTAAGNYATFSRSGVPRIHFKAETEVCSTHAQISPCCWSQIQGSICEL